MLVAWGADHNQYTVDAGTVAVMREGSALTYEEIAAALQRSYDRDKQRLALGLPIADEDAAELPDIPEVVEMLQRMAEGTRYPARRVSLNEMVQRGWMTPMEAVERAARLAKRRDQTVMTLDGGRRRRK